LNRRHQPASRRRLAYDYAERVAANAPLAVFATKQSAVEGLALDLESAYDNETRHSDRVFEDREMPAARIRGPARLCRKAAAPVAGPLALRRDDG
jgi:hypothetical protein